MSTPLQKGATRDAMYRGKRPESESAAAARAAASMDGSGDIATDVAALKADTASIKTILGKDIALATVVSIEDQTATGSQITPEPTVTPFGGTTALTKDTDYVLEYGTNTATGTGTVTIKGANGYHGEKVVTFSIVAAAEQNDG